MSKQNYQNQYRVQYVEKNSQETIQTTKKYNNNNNDGYNYNRYKKNYNNRNYDNRQSVEYQQKQQICQPLQNVYDIKLLISAFREEQQPPEEIIQLQTKLPFLFATKPQKPISNQTQNNLSDEDDPEWMTENEFNGNIQFQDIEIEIQQRREKYQKEHGTFEKKQEEKQQMLDQFQQLIQETNKIEIEKQKYLEKLEQEQKLQETQNKLNQLFSLNLSLQQNNIQISKIPTVEEIEKQQLQPQQQLEEKPQILQQQQQQQFNSQPINESKQQQEQINNISLDKGFSDDELNKILGFTNEENIKKILFKQENIKTSPFSIQAQLHQQDINEKLWFYIDNHNKIQGGFTTKHMDIWYSQNYFKRTLMISWIQPGNWIYLEQFQNNLQSILDGNIDKLKAMDPKVVESSKICQPLLNIQPQQWNNHSNNNINNNNCSNNNQQYYQNNNGQRQQYNKYNNQYNNNHQYGQRNRNNNNNNNQGRTIFQIGQKEQQYNQQYYYQNNGQQQQSDEGFILDPRNFPTPDEK